MTSEIMNKKGGGAFSEVDIAICKQFAFSTGLVIQNALISEKNLRAEKEKAQKLLQLSAMISKELDTMHLIPRVVNLTTQLLDSDRAAIYLIDEHSGELWSTTASDNNGESPLYLMVLELQVMLY